MQKWFTTETTHVKKILTCNFFTNPNLDRQPARRTDGQTDKLINRWTYSKTKKRQSTDKLKD